MCVEEIGAVAVVGLEALQLGEIDLAAELDRVRASSDRHIVLEQRLILVVVLGEIGPAEDEQSGIADVGSGPGSTVIGDDIGRTADVRDRAVGRGVARDEQFVQPIGAAVVPPGFVPVLVVAISVEASVVVTPPLIWRFEFVADEGADVDGVVGRREIGQLSEVELLLERRREAAVILRPGGLRIGLRRRRKRPAQVAVIDVDVVRAERLVGALEVDEERQLVLDDRPAEVAAIIFGVEIRLLVGAGGIVEMPGRSS